MMATTGDHNLAVDTLEYLAMAWESGQPEVFGGIGLGRSSALDSTPGYPV